ncbi:MAG: polyprenyl synthetase family protein [Candidatus Lokiarchaeota archaeon]|nr:polyprenyl synthetase family protein [Candidatus Lokiarchaeota archaeon]
MANSFLKDYYSEMKDYFLAGGKRIRPLLTIATYNGINKTMADEIVRPSVGMEFLHNATLIHDDIIDNDDFRRGNPAFHYRFQLYHSKYQFKKMDAVDFGTSIGIIGGDTAFIMGSMAYFINDFSRDMNLNSIRYYRQAFTEVIHGVLIEIDMVNNKKLSIDEYINMTSLKTGALIEKSILIGASYANVEKEFIPHLSTYGVNLGIIFQIIDDILGTFGDEKVTGKPTDGDIREGKHTCLLIEAMNKLEAKKQDQLKYLISKSEISSEEVQEVKDLYMEADAIDSCKKLATKYYEEARDALEKLKTVVNDSEIEFFENLLKFVLERKF